MMLTVGDLIKKLQKLPQDLLVVSGTYAVPIVDVSVFSMDDSHILDIPSNGRDDAKVVAFHQGSWE